MAKLQIVLEVIGNAMKALGEVNDEVDNIIKNADIDLEINAQDNASDEIEKIKNKADNLPDEPAEIKIEALDEATKEIERIKLEYEELKSLAPPELHVQIEEEASKKIDEIKNKAMDLAGVSPNIKAMVDSSAYDDLGSIQQKAEGLDGLSPKIKPVVDGDEAIASLDAITNKVEGLDGLSGVIAGAIAGMGLEQMLNQGVDTATNLDKSWRNWVGSLQQSGKSFAEATKGADRFKSKVNELAAAGQSNDSMFKNIAGLAINLNNNISDSTLQMTENVVAGYELLGARSGATIYEMEKELKNFLSTGELGLMQDTLSSLSDPQKWIGLLEGADTVDERIKVLRDMMEEEGIMGALNIDAPSKSIDLLKATFEAKMTDIGTFLITTFKPVADFFLWLDGATGGVSTTIMSIVGVFALLTVGIIGVASMITTMLIPGLTALGITSAFNIVSTIGLGGALDLAALSVVAYATGASTATVASTGLWASIVPLLVAAAPFIAIALAIVGVVVAIQELGKYMGWWSDWGTMIESFSAGIQRLWSAFINNPGVVAFIQSVKEAWDGFVTTIMQYLQPIISAFQGFWNMIFPPQTGEFDIVRAIIDAFGMLGNVVGQVITTIAPFATFIFDVMVMPLRILGSVLGPIIGFWVSFITELSRLVSGEIDIGTFIANIVTHLTNMVTLIGTNLYSAFMGFINSFLSVFSGLPGQIWNFLVMVVTNIANFYISVYSWAIKTGIGFVTGIISWIKQLPGKIWTWLINTISRISNFVSQGIAKARQVGSGIVNGVINFVTGLPGKVYNEFLNIGQRILSAGSGIVEKAKQVGKNIVDGIMNAMGIHSPGFIQNNIANEFMALPGRIISVAGDALEAAKTVGNSIQSGFGTQNLDITANPYTKEEGSNTRIYDVDTTGAEGKFTTLQDTIANTALGVGTSIANMNNSILGLNTNLNTNSSTMTSTFSNMGSTIATTLNNLASSNRLSWDNVNATTNSNLKNIRSGTNTVTSQMMKAWQIMGSSLTNTAGNIRSKSYAKFNSLHKSISSFYNQLASARFSSGGLTAGAPPGAGILSLFNAPIGRRPSSSRTGGKLSTNRSKTTMGGAGGPSNSNFLSAIKDVSSKKIFSLLDLARTSKYARQQLESILFSHGLTYEDILANPFGTVDANVKSIYNKGREYGVGDPYFLGVRIPTNWKAKDFENGNPSMGSFESILSAVIGARGLSYDFYFGDGKSNQGVWDSGLCNCYDGAQLIVEIADMLGQSGSLINGYWGSIPHTAAKIGGKIFDMTQFQNRGVWRGSSGVSFGGAGNGNGIFDTMVSLLEKIVDFFTPTSSSSNPVLDMSSGNFFNPSNGQYVDNTEVVVSKGAIQVTSSPVIHIDNSNGNLDEEKIAKLSAEEIEKSLNDSAFINKLVKALQARDNNLRRFGGRG
ncbi:MAG: hypothetical protein LBM02_08230 [Lachnospiraceae bacterium]|jgi:hypothetical protein|nr:hypothetical protein [Lachnospiraceae bacterium]